MMTLYGIFLPAIVAISVLGALLVMVYAIGPDKWAMLFVLGCSGTTAGAARSALRKGSFSFTRSYHARVFRCSLVTLAVALSLLLGVGT